MSHEADSQYCSDQSDSEEEFDPVSEKYGDSPLVAAHDDPNRVEQLINEGQVVTANAVLAACWAGKPHTLQILLSANRDPNIRLSMADRNFADLEDDWATSDLTPLFGVDKREWYPLQHAATMAGFRDKEASSAMASQLCCLQPDLFALFKQPIWKYHFHPFPGEGGPIDWSGDDVLEKLGMFDGEWQQKPDPECGYGLRSLLHSLFEEGGYIEPFFCQPDLRLDVSHRDPQGRTLLHSICRNTVGADAVMDATVWDFYPPVDMETLIAPEGDSLFHAVRKLGADVEAVDSSGKTVLHHLLEAQTPAGYTMRPPLIRNTLKYLLQQASDLVNRPDRHGTYPLHTALQRLRGKLEEKSLWLQYSPLEAVVRDLLDAGADPTVRDSRGNTVLHYLADNGVEEQFRAEEARELCRRFCTAGVNVNARNTEGKTALELLFANDGQRSQALSSRAASKRKDEVRPKSELDGEVLATLDAAGARWTERNAEGRTLLHVVAGHRRTNWDAFRVQYLLDKGVDRMARDRGGKTAADVAREVGNELVLELLNDGN